MIKKWNEKVEKIFDQPNQPQASAECEELKKAFDVTLDNQSLENMSYVFSTLLTAADMGTVFTQLSSFFEMGFLIEPTLTKNVGAVSMAFAYSKHMAQVDNLKPIRIPKPAIFQVLKTDATAFLSKFNLQNFNADKKLQAFLIRVTDAHTIVVMSGLAEPWLQLRIESLQKTLMRVHFES
ncbi:MAG: hypothetical protein H7061_06070 [Bdellovibrionaceae bacterium]|nr:hypothetical protein [Bdellovibrio sp.]